MADCISFSKKYLDFVCEPYKSSYASYLNAFQLIKIKDDENKEVLYKDEEYLRKTVRYSRFRVIGGAGTIGSAICKEIFNFEPFKILKRVFFNNYSSVPVFQKNENR